MACSRCGWIPMRSTRLPMPTLVRTSASSSRMVLSSRSLLLSTPGSNRPISSAVLATFGAFQTDPCVGLACARTMRRAGKAATLALVRGRVPRMPEPPRRPCGSWGCVSSGGCSRDTGALNYYSHDIYKVMSCNLRLKWFGAVCCRVTPYHQMFKNSTDLSVDVTCADMSLITCITYKVSSISGRPRRLTATCTTSSTWRPRVTPSKTSVSSWSTSTRRRQRRPGPRCWLTRYRKH